MVNKFGIKLLTHIKTVFHFLDPCSFQDDKLTTMVDHMGYTAEEMKLNAVWLTNSPSDVSSATVNGVKAMVHKNNVSIQTSNIRLGGV